MIRIAVGLALVVIVVANLVFGSGHAWQALFLVPAVLLILSAAPRGNA